jgi:hypothetical protein
MNKEGREETRREGKGIKKRKAQGETGAIRENKQAIQQNQ